MNRELPQELQRQQRDRFIADNVPQANVDVVSPSAGSDGHLSNKRLLHRRGLQNVDAVKILNGPESALTAVCLAEFVASATSIRSTNNAILLHHSDNN